MIEQVFESGGLTMPLSIDEGKVHIVALLTAEAEKQAVKLNDVRWLQQENAKEPYILRVTNEKTGRIEDARFSVKHLTDREEDDQMKMQVIAKIVGLVIQLGKR
jgi:hypothetical protein